MIANLGMFCTAAHAEWVSQELEDDFGGKSKYLFSNSEDDGASNVAYGFICEAEKPDSLLFKIVVSYESQKIQSDEIPISLDFGSKGQPVLTFRFLSQLTPGKVTMTAEKGQHIELLKLARQFKLSQKQVSIRVTGTREEVDGPMFRLSVVGFSKSFSVFQKSCGFHKIVD